MAGSKFDATDIEQSASFLAQLEGDKPLLSAASPAPQAAPAPATPAINMGLS